MSAELAPYVSVGHNQKHSLISFPFRSQAFISIQLVYLLLNKRSIENNISQSDNKNTTTTNIKGQKPINTMSFKIKVKI